jgi:hypothetical protein
MTLDDSILTRRRLSRALGGWPHIHDGATCTSRQTWPT